MKNQLIAASYFFPIAIEFHGEKIDGRNLLFFPFSSAWDFNLNEERHFLAMRVPLLIT